VASDYHEPFEELDERCRDLHRALTSLKEEIEAVDWYQQRVALCSDPSLAHILAHNRDEEIEHACMTLGWLRRNVPAWETSLQRYVFNDAETNTHIESTLQKSAETPAPKSLGIGGLKGGPS